MVALVLQLEYPVNHSKDHKQTKHGSCQKLPTLLFWGSTTPARHDNLKSTPKPQARAPMTPKSKELFRCVAPGRPSSGMAPWVRLSHLGASARALLKAGPQSKQKLKRRIEEKSSQAADLPGLQCLGTLHVSGCRGI